MSQLSHAVATLKSDAACFIVGQDAEGHWLALEQHRRAGGLFKTRQDALHFAELETAHRPGAVQVAALPLRLTF